MFNCPRLKKVQAKDSSKTNIKQVLTIEYTYVSIVPKNQEPFLENHFNVSERAQPF